MPWTSSRVSVRIKSEPGRGTSFHLVIPYTKASFKGNFVRVSEQTFVIPSSALEQGLRISQDAITAAGSANVIEYQDETIGIVHLGDILGISRPMETETSDHVIAVVCRSREKACAFIVDEIMGEQDVLIKPLGSLLQKVRGIYGATTGANDEVIPILNMKEILELAFSSLFGPLGRVQPEKASVASASTEKTNAPKRILVVEDSITSRTLITSILSAAGFQVQAATDGIEGYTLLKSEPFDLVVSDIEMPRSMASD
jgi:Chemotaxis protein histidine kinase and related kinases